jgi:hypothetical protein
MSAILAGAKYPVDFLSSGVVAPDRLGRLCSKPDLAADKGEAVRAAQRAEVNRRECPLANEVEHGQRVVGAPAVVRDVRRCSVG